MTAATDPARQAELLLLAKRRSAAARPAGPRPGGRPGPAPLSHAQHRMWLMERLGRAGALYHVPLATRLRGPLDTGALAEALTALTARHAILRTRYGQQGEQPFQEPIAPAPVPVPVVEVAADAAEELLRAEAARPFDLAAGAALRALVLRHGPEDHTLLLTLHHIAVDGGSLPVVTEELAALYAAALAGRPAELPEVPLQYADFARWERGREAELDARVAEWAELLDGARPVPLPRPAAGAGRDRTARLHTAELPAATVDGLRALGRRHGATLFTVVLTAAFATLARATGAGDLTLGCAGGQRSRPELRRLVGLCVNTLPIRADLTGDPTFAELLGRVRSAQLAAQGRHEVPFDLVVERLGAAARGQDGSPLLSVTCDLVAPTDALGLPGVAAQAVELDLGLAKFDLGLFLEDGPQPRCLVQHAEGALSGPDGAHLLADFAALLTAVAGDDGLRLDRLPVRAWESEHPAVAALLADPRLGEAFVLERDGLPPLAYAVARGPLGVPAAELRTALRALLPADRVPAAVTLLDALPRTADGAVDTDRLPGARPTAQETPAAHRAHEDTVRTAFGELLGSRPGPDGDFFVLGGHSLVAVQLAERLRLRTGLPLTGLDVLEQRTPRALAALLAGRADEQRAAQARRPAGAAGGGRPVRPGTVLVTGATGGVGAAVLQELMAQGRPVRALARPESAHLVALDGVEVAEGDLADLDSLRAAARGADAVIHAACTFTRHEVDVAAMRVLVESWQRGGFVFISSIDAYGRPVDEEVPEGAPEQLPVTAYGQAKLDCERILLAAAGDGDRGPAAVVRSPIVWGPHRRLREQLRWGATGELFQAAQAGRELVLPDPAADGRSWYGASWVHSGALARAAVAALDERGPAAGRVVNAVSGHLAWSEFAAELARLLDSPSAVRLAAGADPELARPWRYRADALAAAVRPEPGEDWRTVLAAMVR
ncbi:condensation domain-containing protein [Kitasatospora sp. NPDC094015]|uniref:condensation domain-containing protein n=1 Tax=Kitasatospora sp. NPDC094015 TaxID=3155205 RepID=UPI0033234350